MMGWKKRSRRWRGLSPLSAVSVSCGIIFVIGNLYILHSGFSQAYRDLRVADGPGRPDTDRSGGVLADSGVLEGLPVLALEAIGYISGSVQGRQEEGPPRDGLFPQSEHGLKFGDTRLRKLMGNRRDWGSEAQQSFQHKLELRQLPRQLAVQQRPYSVENTGRKQRTSDGTAPNPTSSVAAHPQPSLLSHSNMLTENPNQVLYYRPGDSGPHQEHRTDQLVNRGSQFSVKSHQVADVPAAELRRLLVAGSRCGYVRGLTGREYVGSGWTKAVYRAHPPAPASAPVAVKTVDLTGHDMAACGQKPGMGLVSCYQKASQKLLKEMLLLQAFNHPNIIKMLGYCVPEKPYNGDADSLVAMVTELGETIDIIKLLQMSWEDRLRVSYGVTRLLQYLADSPFGSVALNDFRRQQFVLVGGEVTLTDLDDVGFEEPLCDGHTDCVQHFSSANFTLRTPCVDGRCVGFNEKKNVFNAARHFTTFLLPHGAPPSLRPAVDAVVHAYSNVTLPAAHLLTMLDGLVDAYRQGSYLQRAPHDRHNKYTVHADADLPGLFDYKCRFSIAGGCTLSVFDQREAEQLCDLDPECRAFVISDERTWTGRMIVHLKNNFTSPSTRQGMSLCVKPGL